MPKFGLTDFVNAVGEKNIKVQWLLETLTNVSYKKKVDANAVTFLTKEFSAGDVLGVTPDSTIGIILWVPRSKLPPEIFKNP